MRAVEQWERIEEGLPQGWEDARLAFTVEDPKFVEHAAGVLSPLGPGRSGSTFRIQVRPTGGTTGTESLRNLLRRLDRGRTWGELELVDVTGAEEAAAPRAEETPAAEAVPTLVAAWDEELATLQPDWSDLLCELEVDSTDFLPRAALLGAPLNPTRVPGAAALRFRAGRGGYGTSPTMARRCFERMDDEAITGRIRVLNALSNVGNVGTQGPVWRVAGRAV
jgi:hypothetical protein